MKITIILFITFFLITVPNYSQDQISTVQPYYGYYPSEKGVLFKELRHNILGFAITIPADWVFGIFGIPPLQVAILYQENLNTAVFSTDYQTIEIGQLPESSVDLETAYQFTVDGMKLKHPKLSIIKKPFQTSVGDNPSLSWIQTWAALNGTVIIEDIRLVMYMGTIHCISIRSSKEKYDANKAKLIDVINSFNLIEPIYR